MLSFLRRALAAYENLTEPRWLKTELPFPEVSGCTLVHCRLLQDGPVARIETLSSDRDLAFRRSWLSPWRRHAFMRLAAPRTDRTILHACPAMILRDAEGEREASESEMSTIITDHLNDLLWRPVSDPWFPPALFSIGELGMLEC